MAHNRIYQLDRNSFSRYGVKYGYIREQQRIARNLEAKRRGMPKREIDTYVAVDMDKIIKLHDTVKQLHTRATSVYIGVRGSEITKFVDVKEAHKVVERKTKECLKLILELVHDDDFFLTINGQGEHI